MNFESSKQYPFKEPIKNHELSNFNQEHRCPTCRTVNNEERTRMTINSIETISYLCKPCETIFKVMIDLSKDGTQVGKLTKFSSGATRSSDANSERYDLISPHATKREAIVMAEGVETHGERNWEKGIPISVCLNHLERHLQLWKMGDRDEDHLAKIRINAGFIMHFEEMEKIKNES